MMEEWEDTTITTGGIIMTTIMGAMGVSATAIAITTTIITTTMTTIIATTMMITMTITMMIITPRKHEARYWGRGLSYKSFFFGLVKSKHERRESFVLLSTN